MADHDKIILALDRQSARRSDVDGHLHVDSTPISKANVCGYRGNEIPDYQALGLDANRIYQLLRDPEELEKAAASFNGKPLLNEHKPVTADDHDHDVVAGSVNNVTWSPPYLRADLSIWDGDSIRDVESGKQRELSSAYRYRFDPTPGVYEGVKYDGRMVDIAANHVALVERGRAGPDVLVGDQALQSLLPPPLKEMFMPVKAAIPSRTAAMAHGALMIYARPKLAQDAKLDISPLFKGINAKNIKAKAPEMAASFHALLKPKLAADADLDQADVQAIVEQVAEIIDSEADTIAEAVAEPMASADDEDDAQLRAMLKAKGYSDEEIDSICNKSMASAPAAADDSPEAKAKKEADVRTVQDEAVRAATKDMVTKTAMDAAISAAVKLATDSVTKRQRDIHEALEHVKPVTGHLAMAHDSAESVFRTALKAMKVADVDALPDQALRPVFDAHRAAQSIVATKTATPLAADAASRPSFEDRFPDAKRFHI